MRWRVVEAEEAPEAAADDVAGSIRRKNVLAAAVLAGRVGPAVDSKPPKPQPAAAARRSSETEAAAMLLRQAAGLAAGLDGPPVE